MRLSRRAPKTFPVDARARCSFASKGRSGQILIPALLMFPTLMLFVYLIYETAKLSREKIRHQFAIDSAAFVEMTNYSDFLNRTAYVNGAFPMRIFYEGFHSTTLNNMGKSNCDAAVNQYATGGSLALDDLLYGEGTFPRDPAYAYQDSEAPGSASWKIAYDPASIRGPNLNTATPSNFDSSNAHTDPSGKNCGQTPCLTLISEQTANCWNINWDDATSVMNLYVQIYQLLGSVESAQFSVLQRLATGHQFFTKSYWLNLGTQEALSEAQGVAFPPVNFLSGVQMHCIPSIFYYANKLMPGNMLQPYGIFNNSPGTGMASTINGCDGLFQLATVNPGMIQSAEKGNPYPGWPASITWTPPQNSFNVPLGTAKVHATASFWPGADNEAAVWPAPTPHFQTRLYP